MSNFTIGMHVNVIGNQGGVPVPLGILAGRVCGAGHMVRLEEMGSAAGAALIQFYIVELSEGFYSRDGDCFVSRIVVLADNLRAAL